MAYAWQVDAAHVRLVSGEDRAGGRGGAGAGAGAADLLCMSTCCALAFLSLPAVLLSCCASCCALLLPLSLLFSASLALVIMYKNQAQNRPYFYTWLRHFLVIRALLFPGFVVYYP